MTELHKSFSSEVFVLGQGWKEKKDVSTGDEILVYDEDHKDVRWGVIKKKVSYQYDGEYVYRALATDGSATEFIMPEYDAVPLQSGDNIETCSAVACFLMQEPVPSIPVDLPLHTPIFAQAKPFCSPTFVRVGFERLSGYDGQVHALSLNAQMYLCRQGDTIFGSMSASNEVRS